MEKIVRQSMLYDFYGELLTEHQKSVYEDVVNNDMSYSEIARLNNISRQGVYDMVRRCDKILEEYEEKLMLVHKFMKAQEQVQKIKECADAGGPHGLGGRRDQFIVVHHSTVHSLSSISSSWYRRPSFL